MPKDKIDQDAIKSMIAEEQATPGAKRAAGILLGASFSDLTRKLAAEIIDRETGLPELVGALRQLVTDTELLIASGITTGIALINARAVLAKHEGETR